MKKVLVLGGAGLMGRATVIDLLENTNVDEVIIGDLNVAEAKKVAERSGGGNRVSIQAIDLQAKDDLNKLVKSVDGVINCAIYKFNLSVMEAALEARVPYTDLGGFWEITKKQLELDKRFREAGVTAIPCMGSCPGTGNVMAKYAVDQLDSVEEVTVYNACGDYAPPEQQAAFSASYNLDVMIDELSIDPYTFTNGQLKQVKVLKDGELVNFPEPIGSVVAYHTKHSEALTMSGVWASKGLKTCGFKLALPTDFVETVQLLKAIGITSEKSVRVGDVEVNPRRVLAAILAQDETQNSEPDDCDFIKVVVKGMEGSRNVEYIMEMVARPHSQWKIGATALDTGIPPVIAMDMMLNGEIDTPGVFPPEAIVPPEKFFTELRKREMEVFASKKILV